MIYLDIDGVLILSGDAADSLAVKQRARLVSDLCKNSGASIVISSQRRISDDVITLLTDLGLDGHMTRQADQRTPFLTDLDPDLPVRGQEIDAHMKANNVQRHVILDDDFALATHRQVHVDPQVGLTQRDIQQAQEMLCAD